MGTTVREGGIPLYLFFNSDFVNKPKQKGPSVNEFRFPFFIKEIFCSVECIL